MSKASLLPSTDEKYFKFSFRICINCIRKMLIWGHFCGIMELLLKDYLEHFLIIEKTIVFLFMASTIKPTSLLHANVQMPWHTECNQSNWQQPECFYESESPITTLKSGQPKLPVRNIHQPYRWPCIHARSDKSAAYARTWMF